MVTITAKLIKDGNSTAVRLPKALLKMSGLTETVLLEAKKGQIVIKQQKKYPRQGWEEQISKLVAEHGDPGAEFKDWDATSSDGLESLPWDGPTYEQWQKQQAKH